MCLPSPLPSVPLSPASPFVTAVISASRMTQCMAAPMAPIQTRGEGALSEFRTISFPCSIVLPSITHVAESPAPGIGCSFALMQIWILFELSVIFAEIIPSAYWTLSLAPLSHRRRPVLWSSPGPLAAPLSVQCFFSSACYCTLPFHNIFYNSRPLSHIPRISVS